MVHIVSAISGGMSFAAVLVSWPMGSSLGLNLASIALFVAGIALTMRRGIPKAGGVERVIPFGRTFFAVPLALFGLQHFVFLKEVQQGVPSWMPGHIFWACLVGAGLIAAALSLITDIRADLAALCVGMMLFLFVLMIYLPGVLAHPHDRFGVTGFLRDLSVSGGALALAGSLGVLRRRRWDSWLMEAGRVFFGVAMLYFGTEQFMHPEFAPGVPYEMLTPTWMPGRLLWSYAMGVVLLTCGVCILANLRARKSAAWLGVAYLGLVVFVYLPMEFAHPSIAISGELDELMDTLVMSGAALLLAGAIKERSTIAP
jgi:uncharacterized membrane protein YphA (DoxX/SURF4 family)